jgi:hypothetical protein
MTESPRPRKSNRPSSKQRKTIPSIQASMKASDVDAGTADLWAEKSPRDVELFQLGEDWARENDPTAKAAIVASIEAAMA